MKLHPAAGCMFQQPDFVHMNSIKAKQELLLALLSMRRRNKMHLATQIRSVTAMC